jgi:(1->4)-alpha-D-glucan 1-alpha-D-glucosylmutase
VDAPSDTARPRPSRPSATYRIQLHAGFTFDDAAACAPYLAALGVSHLYCSPVLEAAPGSSHGYDVVDHSQLSEERGGAAGFARLVDAARDAGLGIVLDIVPNHMALAGRRNRWWWDVLEDGPSSRYARYFDIDWGRVDEGASEGPSVLMPVLGDHYGRALEAGELELARQGGSFVVRYHDHELPLSPRSMGPLVARAAGRAGSAELRELAAGLRALPHAATEDPDEVAGRQQGKVALRRQLAALVHAQPEVAEALDDELRAVEASPDALDALLSRQNYRLAHWRVADEELDYRRFFNITTLAGLRVEEERVFADSHRLVADLLDGDVVTGLRIDHVDGLRDPAGYLERLRALAPDAYLVVEKILEADELLPPWTVDGTSGYDGMVKIAAVFVDQDREAELTEVWQGFTGDATPYDEVVHAAKLQVMASDLAAETGRVVDLLAQVCAGRRRHRDHTRSDLHTAVTEVAAALDAYRTYVVPGRAPSDTDRALVARAVERAGQRRPDLDGELLDLLGRVLLLDEPDHTAAELAVRFQQLTAPVTAKGVEDTAFYRYLRLVALNDVGGDPGTFGLHPGDFHRHQAAVAARWPGTMVTLSTHDTKRSGDVRARLALLSEIPGPWSDVLHRWSAHTAAYRDPLVDRPTEVLLHQTLVGAWPIDADRLIEVMTKSVREAKVHTTWGAPDEAYEGAVTDLAARARADESLVADLEGFLAAHRLVERGRVTSLAQTALLLTVPGVPDVYQGTELWDLSLVDPDNRRPVDFHLRAKLLEDLRTASPEEALAHLDDGGAKLWLTHHLLQHRRRDPGAFDDGRYEPVPGRGEKARHLLGFQRERLVVLVPRLLVGLAEDWGDTTARIPAGDWVDLLTGDPVAAGDQPLAELTSRFPVVVLASR